MGDPIMIHRDELAAGVKITTGEPLVVQFGEVTGEFHVLVRDHEGHDPIPHIDYTIEGPHDVSFGGKTGDDGSIHHPDPKSPIDTYQLKMPSVSDSTFQIQPRSSGDPFIVRVPGFPKADPPPPDPVHDQGPDCLSHVQDPPQWLQNKGTRDLTLTDARTLAIWFLKNGWIEFHTKMTPPPTFHHDGTPAICRVSTPHVEDHVVIKPTIHGVVWLYLSEQLPMNTSKWRNQEWIDQDNPDKSIAKQRCLHNSKLCNMEWRNVVLVTRLTKYLKDKWGATHLYHIGMGAGGGASNDCHNQGRAIDFAGGMGTVPADYPVAELRNQQWDLNVYHDWGRASDPGPGTYRLQQTPADLIAHAAFFFFQDIWTFLQAHVQEKSSGRCPYDPSTGAPTGDDPNGDQRAVGTFGGGFICHPDYVNNGSQDLRTAHANHYHFQVGKTKDDVPAIG
jgi:hypothetical protein